MFRKNKFKKMSKMKQIEKILKILEDLKETIFIKYKVKKIGIFGSYIREEQQDMSDIDILVDFSEGADLIDFIGLALFLEEKLGRKVDLVPERALRDELKGPIHREAVYV